MFGEMDPLKVLICNGTGDDPCRSLVGLGALQKDAHGHPLEELLGPRHHHRRHGRQTKRNRKDS